VTFLPPSSKRDRFPWSFLEEEDIALSTRSVGNVPVTFLPPLSKRDRFPWSFLEEKDIALHSKPHERKSPSATAKAHAPARTRAAARSRARARARARGGERASDSQCDGASAGAKPKQHEQAAEIHGDSLAVPVSLFASGLSPAEEEHKIAR
jgi:hypothetical protein